MAANKIKAIPKRSTRGKKASRTPADDDDESDDPLALTPLRQSDKTHRRPMESSSTSRIHRSVDRIIGGVEMPEGDLVPPSDEEEFDLWAAALSRRKQATSPTRQIPRAPAKFSLFSDDESAEAESESPRSRRSSTSSSDLTPPPSQSFPPRRPLPKISPSFEANLPSSPPISSSERRHGTSITTPRIVLETSPGPSRRSRTRSPSHNSPSRLVSPDARPASPRAASPPPISPSHTPATTPTPKYTPVLPHGSFTSIRPPSNPPSQSPFHLPSPAAPPLSASSSDGGIPAPKAPSPKPPTPVHQQYQSARTFRTRTALQLQPYTRERQVYEAVLRKGGVKRVKVAVPREASSEEDFNPSPELEPVPRAAEVTRVPRTYRIVDITAEDREEFFLRHKATPSEDSDADLQKIARERLRTEQEQRRRRREELRIEKEFDRLNAPSSPLHFAHMSQSPPRPAPPSPSAPSSPSLTSPSASPSHKHHPLDRIANRMLPAILLKKDAAKVSSKRKASKPRATTGAVAPGRAVRRRGDGDVDISNMFNDEASSDGSASPLSSHQSHQRLSSAESMSGSQAEEDNHGETLARLYDGDFDTIVRGRAAGYQRKRKRRRPAAPRRRAKPVIRLTERSIFSMTDFDIPQPVADALQSRIDKGVGKAKSWANLARFSADFDITPLPSGLECTGFPVPRVAALIDTVESQIISPIERASHLGVDFDLSSEADVLAEAVERYFGALQQQLFEALPADAAIVVDFLMGKLDDGDFVELLETHLDTLESHIGKIVANGVEEQRMLGVLWYVLELRLVAAARWPTDPRRQAVEGTATTIFQLLLLAGFDQAIHPLKICLRGESVNGKMTDTLTSHWIAAARTIDAYGRHISDPDILVRILLHANDSAFHFDLVGPVASERIWYITFGLGAISQFNDRGRTTSGYQPVPRWGLVRKALGMIKIAHEDESEEKRDAKLFLGRDRYVRVMMARCVKLSAVWNWGFDRGTFPIITRDLGTTFKQRQYRNFPTEPAVDYPDWVVSFDIEKTSLEARGETAFEMYLRLVCVAAADIAKADEQLADRDIQRLIISIIPVSPVKFNRLCPPTPRQLAQLINRYTTMVAACHFSPSILRWLLANSRKWMAFEMADFDSRQITIRGLMYVAVACQRHEGSLQAIIERLSEIMRLLQREQDSATNDARQLEAQRTMVLVISCFKQIILRHSYIAGLEQIYPDPILLDPSWTLRIFELSAQDFQSGLEVVSAVQAYLDVRASVLPPSAKRAREERLESQEEFESFGFELDPTTIAQLGGGADVASPDMRLATILDQTICPRIYRLLSDILNGASTDERRAILIQRLAVCWADCAAILVVDHRRLEWTTFIGPFGSQSWVRLGDDAGRIQVGLHFMLSVLQLDASAFANHSDEFISLFFSVIGTNRVTVEHKLVSALCATSHPLFNGVNVGDLDAEQFFAVRNDILEVIFSNMSDAFESNLMRKPFLYRCINDLVSSLERCYKAIPDPIPQKTYLAKAETIIQSLCSHVDINSSIVPALKAFID